MPGIETVPGIAPAAIARRLDRPVELVCGEEAEFATFLNEHIHGQPEVAQVEAMTRIDMSENQFLPRHHVP